MNVKVSTRLHKFTACLDRVHIFVLSRTALKLMCLCRNMWVNVKIEQPGQKNAHANMKKMLSHKPKCKNYKIL
jgi:hypothetical protein